MRVLMPVYGTHGDVLPFLAIGQALVRRGHEVVMLAPAPFARPAERAGLTFHPLGTQADYDAMLDRPELRRLLASLKLGFETGLRVADTTFRWIEANLLCGDTVVVAPPQCYGVRIAQECFGLPAATVHLTPFMIESRIASPRLPGLPVPAVLSSRFRHRLSRGSDRYVVDRLALPALNAYRARFALPPVRRFRHWWNSPNRMILVFPDWYAPKQLDWPLQAVQVGFPLADRLGDASDLPAEVTAFLDAGPEPLVFVYSSWMREANAFFATALRTCERMGRRGILLSPQMHQVPRDLPHGVIHVSYAPLSLLLPRCTALIHHGGVGTVAQALAAGVPQVVVPFMGDHFDEAERLRRIGVGAVLSRYTLTAGRVARALRRLLRDPTVKQACAAARSRIMQEDGVGKTCDEIEALSGTMTGTQRSLRPTSNRRDVLPPLPVAA